MNTKAYANIKPLENDLVDSFVADYCLFTIFDSPINVLFIENFVDNIKKYKDIFMHYNMRNNIFFSCKANKGLSFLSKASQLGCGIEVSSFYELTDALKFTNRIISSGPAKDDLYIDTAISNRVLISVDDIEELKIIRSKDKEANILIRISNLSNIVSRFGINIDQIDDCLEIIKSSKINLDGFAFHINNYDLNDRVAAIFQIVDIVESRGINIKYIDIGGGFPVNYCSDKEFRQFTRLNNEKMYYKNKLISNYYPYNSKVADGDFLINIIEKVRDRIGKVEIIIEPGRSLLTNCGISIFKIEYLKSISNGDNMIVTNGNINCLSEQWFNTDFLVSPILYKKNKTTKLRDPYYACVAGNLCLEQDIITNRKIQFDYMPEKGDYLIYYNTAGYQMDSNESCFHKIPLIKKIVVEKNEDKYNLKEDKEYDS